MIQVTANKLKEILEEAYEAGWHGCLELKNQVASEILDKHFPNKDFTSFENHYSQLMINGFEPNTEHVMINNIESTTDQITLNLSDTTITVSGDYLLNGQVQT